MSYASTRRLILAVGLGVLLLVAAVMYLRRVDTVEVLAVLLFIPVFLAFVFWDLIGGVVAGVGAAICYAVLRQPAIDAVGGGRFATLIASRGISYLAFGILGGWANQALERSLEKLDVYDQIDDETGLFNARFFVQDTALEAARAVRYKTFFSICVVDVPTAALDAMPRRKRAALLNDLGHQMKDAIRSVDRAVHARDGGAHRFAVICPETGTEGATVFVDRLAERLAEFVKGRGATIGADVLPRMSCTVPGDDERLAALRAEFAAINRMEHPEHPVPPVDEDVHVT
jgi:GGDEF domain-containing protein